LATYLYSLIGGEIASRGISITDRNCVDEVVKKSGSIYGVGDFKMYHMDFDAAVSVPIRQILIGTADIRWKLNFEYKRNGRSERPYRSTLI